MKKTLAFAISAQAVSILILLILSSQFFKQLESLSSYTSSVEHAYMVIYQLAQVRSEMKDAETSTRGFLVTDRPEFLKLLNKSKTEFFTAMDSLRALVKENSEQMIFVKRTERLGYEILRAQLENARLKTRMTSDSLVKRLEFGRVQMEEMEYLLEKMKANELIVLNERNAQRKTFEARLPGYTRSVFMVAGLLTLFFGLWIFIELRKRFRFQALLQQKVMELRQNNEELEQIAFAASHDLQEPLRKIRIFSDRMQQKSKQKSDEDFAHMSGRINLAATKLQELIGDLVTFNNLVQNNYTLEPVSLQEMFDNDLHLARKKLEETGALLEVDELPVVQASHEQLQILFQQVLENAIQFRCPSKALHIRIKCERVLWSNIAGLPTEFTEGNFYHISIADNGVGFDEAFKGKMFKPFQRLHNYDTDTTTGRKGMGLAICKRVMLNSGGWIDAEGKVGDGATIHLYFPAT